MFTQAEDQIDISVNVGDVELHQITCYNSILLLEEHT